MQNIEEAKQTSRLPVTVLSGFLGAGKTTLLKRILKSASQSHKRFAILVNDMASLNIDAQLIKQSSSETKQAAQKMVQLQGGCICCSLREDLLKEVRQLALQKSFDYLVIESTGVAQPLPIAETFTFTTEMAKEMGMGHEDHKDCDHPHVIPEILADVAELDTMVTLIDAGNFFEYLESEQDLKALENRLVSKGEVVPEEDQRSVAHLLIDQIEFANVVIINKTDLLSKESTDIDKIEDIIKRINPDAKLFKTQNSNVPIDAIIGTKLFDFKKAAMNPFWLKEIRGQEKMETEQYGITSLVYNRRKPFNSAVLLEKLNAINLLKEYGIVRSKGFCWLASRHNYMFEWSGAGNVYTISPAGMWYSVNQEQENQEWTETTEEQKEEIKKDYKGQYRDRRQEIVFIYFVNKTKKTAIEEFLDSLLITEKQFEEGPNVWQKAIKHPEQFGGPQLLTMGQMEEEEWEDEEVTEITK